MYSLNINFLKDRSSFSLDNNKPTKANADIREYMQALFGVWFGVGFGVCVPVLVFGVLLFIQSQNTGLGQQLTKLEEDNKNLKLKLSDIQKIKQETKGIKEQTAALVTVFDQIRPWSAMLQDLRDRIPPNVQVETIKQIPPMIQANNKANNKANNTTNNTTNNSEDDTNNARQLEITGYARSFADLNDFVLIMGKSKLFNAAESRISTAELVEAPPITGAVPLETTTQVKFKPPQVVKYTIKTSLSSIPASQLIRDLEQTGTVGLVERIRNLQKTGVIK